MTEYTIRQFKVGSDYPYHALEKKINSFCLDAYLRGCWKVKQVLSYDDEQAAGISMTVLFEREK